METTVSTSNRFRRNFGSFATTISNNNNTNLQPRPEKEQCLFDIYKKEGDHFFVRKKYKKAVDSYTMALTHKRGDLTVLIARSRCYASMGQLQQALMDAEAALTVNSAYAPAMYQKAQVLYSLGQYDMALLFFHKGLKLNPNASDFTEGVEKAESALVHLTPARRMKTTEVGDLTMYIPKKPNFTRRYQPLKNNTTDRKPEQAPLTPSFRTRQVCKLVSLELQKKPPVTLDQVPQSNGRDVTRSSHPDQSAMRSVLSQLYTDKAYFEKILRDMENTGRFHEEVFHIAGDGLAFIAERMLFWARFGTPAPSSSLLVGSEKKQEHNGGRSLKPFFSERQGRVRFGETSSDEKMMSREMTSHRVGDVDEDDMTCGELQEEQEIDIKRRQKRVGKSEAERSKARVSGTSPNRKRKLRKRRTKKSTRGDKEGSERDLTLVFASDAEKLKFKFDTYRPNTQQPGKTQVAPIVRPLVRTVEELSTDEWDSEWDEYEESDAEATTRRRQVTIGPEEKRKGQEAAAATTQKERMTDGDPVRLYLVKVIRDITAEFEKEGYMMVREKALSVLHDIDKYKPGFMTNKMDLVATLHSLLGNAYLEVSDLNLSLKHHKEDLRIGEEIKYDSVISRALGNLGRTHVLRKEYSVALECFAGKSSYVGAPLEKAWLYHEMSNCFLQLRHYEFARDAAAKALDVATLAQSTMYQLQAAVLLAVSEVRLKEYDQAHEHFTLALDQAKLREDIKAESAITNALHQLNQKLADEARDRLSVSSKQERSAVDDMEEYMRPSLADAEDSELADLKEVDTESVADQEQHIIKVATAVAAHSASRTRQPTPPTWNLNPHQQHTDSQLEQPSSLVAHGEPIYGKKDLHIDGKGEKLKVTLRCCHDQQSFTHKSFSLSEAKTKSDLSFLIPRPSRKRLEREMELRRLKEAIDKEQKAAQNLLPAEESADNMQQKTAQKTSQIEDSCDIMQQNTAQETPRSEHSIDNMQYRNAKEAHQPADSCHIVQQKYVQDIPRFEKFSIDTEQKAEEGTSRSDDYGMDTFRTRTEAELPTYRSESPTQAELFVETEKNLADAEIVNKLSEELVKTMAVRFRSFISEIKSVHEESMLSQRDETFMSNVFTQEVHSLPASSEHQSEQIRTETHEHDNATCTIKTLDRKESEEKVQQQYAEEGGEAAPEDPHKVVEVPVADDFALDEKSRGMDKKAPNENNTEGEERPEEEHEEGKETEENEKLKVDSVVRHLAMELKGIEEALKEEDAEGVTAKAQLILDGYAEDELYVQPYLTLVAKLHSFMGTASMMLEEYAKAQSHHQKDLDIGDLTNDEEIQSRALDNLGRIHVLQKHYDKALEVYVRRLEMNRDDDTSARIFHEIANCFFHVQHYSHARDSARLAVQHAALSHNSLIQLQSTVLMAVCHVKENRNDTACTTFEDALDFAVKRDDKDAEEAIKAAIRSLKSKVRQAVDKFKQGIRDDEEEMSQDHETDHDVTRHKADITQTNGGISCSHDEKREYSFDHEEDKKTEEESDPLAFLRWRRRPAAFIFLDPNCIVQKDGLTLIQQTPAFKLEPLKNKSEETAPLSMEPVILRETIVCPTKFSIVASLAERANKRGKGRKSRYSYGRTKKDVS